MNSIDLHGISHYDISNRIDIFIWDNMKMNKDYIDIVTGNSKRMISLVIKIIEEYKLNYQIGDPYNKGYIRVFLK